MKYCAFDIEISKPVVGDDWKSQRPLGISCAATLTSDGVVDLWSGEGFDSQSYERSLCPIPNKMSPVEVQYLVSYLLEKQESGYTVLTWNGLGFDFDVLAEECENASYAHDVANIAMNHIDIGFQMLTEMGYMIGLGTCAKGLGVGSKTEGMHGDLAPILWTGDLSIATDEQRDRVSKLDVVPGSREAQNLCLVYVKQDVYLTAKVYEALISKGHVYWTTRKGKKSYYPWRPITKNHSDRRLLTVSESLNTPEPDTSWMDSPWKRESFYEWTKLEF